jgi:hypothetical protein
MYDKLAMTGFEYQVYGSEAITYLNASFGCEPAVWVIRLSPHPPLQAALPLSVWQLNLHPFRRELKYGKITIPMLKSKGKTCMVEEPSHVKPLSLNHMCKIGLSGKMLCRTGTKIIW